MNAYSPITPTSYLGASESTTTARSAVSTCGPGGSALATLSAGAALTVGVTLTSDAAHRSDATHANTAAGDNARACGFAPPAGIALEPVSTSSLPLDNVGC